MRILVVDDEASILEALSIVLEAKGYEVKTSNNGIDALNMLTTYEPNLILLDIMMVPLDGLAFIKKMQEMHMIGKYPIIVMTAMLGITEELTELQRSGIISNFMLKPLDDGKMGRIYLLLEDIEQLTNNKK